MSHPLLSHAIPYAGDRPELPDARSNLPAQVVRLAMPERTRLAVVDEDVAFMARLGQELGPYGWRHTALTEAPSPFALARMRLHVLVVDTSALGENPLSWIAEVVHELPQMRVVVCANSSTLNERVSALRLGVDDWIAKPCHVEEMLARVEGVVRGPHHIGPVLDERPLMAGEMTISPSLHQAFAHGVSARLTRREFSLLHLLAREQGHVVERARAYSHVWGYPMVRRDRSVDVHVRRIRGKLRRVSPEWSYIHTHYQVGYRFRATRQAASLMRALA